MQNPRSQSGICAILKVLSHGCTSLHYDENAAFHTAQIRAELEKLGTPIGAYDQMIAGHARACGLMVVTNNTREFQRASGIRTENWAQ